MKNEGAVTTDRTSQKSVGGFCPLPQKNESTDIPFVATVDFGHQQRAPWAEAVVLSELVAEGITDRG